MKRDHAPEVGVSAPIDHGEATGGGGDRRDAATGRGSDIRWRILVAMLLASLVPLTLLGGGVWVVFGQSLERRSLDLHREVVQGHATHIEGYLAEHLHALDLLARTHRLAALSKPGELQRTFEHLGHSHAGAFVDLGIIDSAGDHLAYVGPYQLLGRNYAEAPWFREVMRSGSYVSDVFLGLRGSPHCVVAIRRDEGSSRWILRATIDSEHFEHMVRTERLGQTGDSFIVNADGVYQTPPRSGQVLQRSTTISPVYHEGVSTERLILDGEPVLQATTWLNDRRWMLVVRQSLSEVRAPVDQALRWGGLVGALAMAVMAGTTIFATRHLIKQIDAAIAQRDQLSRELLRSARLASIGELATGLAHEINNPLAIISSERTNLTDVLGELEIPPEAGEELSASIERIRRQVERCSGITGKMLRFGRNSTSKPRPVELEPRLTEIVELMRKQAAIRNVELELSVPGDLPPITADPTELEQVLVNLITNSLQALEGGGRIAIKAREDGDEGVVLTVSDNGCGISQEHLDKIFQPFFTTKPVGQGTGLGLSVCYGLVNSWGGNIEVQSRIGEGTTMTIRLSSPPREGAVDDQPQP